MEENKNKILNVPTLRFGGFSDLWKKSTIEKNAKVYDGTHQTPIYTKSGVKFVSVENINDLYSSGKYISVDDYNSDFKYVPEINDILMTRIGDIGTPALVTKSEPLAYYVSLALLKEIDLEPHFLYHYIQTAPFQKELWRRTLHVAFPKKINKNEIGDCAIFYPSTRCEQKKIALFLDGIEKRIKIQNKIISKYETLIKGLCDKIFRHDKSVCLSDLVRCKTSILQENEIATYYNGEYNVFGASGIIASINKYQFEDDGILVLKDGSKAGKIQYAEGKYSVVGTSVVLIPNNADDARYLYFAMLSIDFDKYKVGSGIPHIYFKDYSYERIYYPNSALRIMIAKVLDAYETKVETEKEMLSALQKQKAFLLQSMFI